MKRLLSIICILAMVFTLTACGYETAPKEDHLEVLPPLKGSILTMTHDVEGFKFITTYDTGDYDLGQWRITDSKFINMTAQVEDMPEGTIVLVEHVHIDMVLQSTNPQVDGLMQDSMDDSYHGVSQDGFYIDSKYKYQNQFSVEGFSKDLIEGWGFVCGEYGYSNLSQTRLTERNLIKNAGVEGSKMLVVYDILIRYPGEDYFHVVSVKDEFKIPVTYIED